MAASSPPRPASPSSSRMDRQLLPSLCAMLPDRLGADQVLRRWLHIFDHVEWGVVIDSADGRTFERVNPAFARMHGYTVEELVGRPVTEVFAPEAKSELPGQIPPGAREGPSHVRVQTYSKRWECLSSVGGRDRREGRGRARASPDHQRAGHHGGAGRQKKRLEKVKSGIARFVAAMQEGIVFQDADGRISACNCQRRTNPGGLRVIRMVGQDLARSSLARDSRKMARRSQARNIRRWSHCAPVQPQSNVIMASINLTGWSPGSRSTLNRCLVPARRRPMRWSHPSLDITASKRAEQVAARE